MSGALGRRLSNTERLAQLRMIKDGSTDVLFVLLFVYHILMEEQGVLVEKTGKKMKNALKLSKE